MRKTISAIILLTLSSVSVNTLSDNNKVQMCHKGNKEISVAKPSVPAHTNHGDTLGDCEEETLPKIEYMAAVVMMRCEAVTGNGVVVVSASSSVNLDVAVILPFPPEAETDCATALAGLLNTGFKLRSITSGSADNGGSLHLYTDYLLIGKAPAER
ncbi:MAG: hypothetical protein V7754_14840 [Halioglobus sp.]